MKAIVAAALALGLMTGVAQAQHRSHGHHGHHGQHHVHGHHASSFHAPVRHHAPVYHAPVRHHAPVYHAPVRHHAPVYHAPVRHSAPVYQAPVVSYGHVHRPAYAPVYGHGQRVVIQQPTKVVAAPVAAAAAAAPVQAIEPQQDLKSAEGQISTGPANGPATIEAAPQPVAPAPQQ